MEGLFERTFHLLKALAGVALPVDLIVRSTVDISC